VELSKRKFRDLELVTTQKMEGEVLSKYILYDQAITKLADENKDLKKRLNDTIRELNRRAEEVNHLSPLQSELEALRRQIVSYESSIGIYEKEVS
jgi:chromosome segregation ATPase